MMGEDSTDTDAPAKDHVDLGAMYARSRTRLCSVITDAGPAATSTEVAACPGWTVHDVVAHLVGVIEDAFAGRINGVPSAEQTAEQVARHRDDTWDELVATWNSLAASFEPVITSGQIWPALLDVVTHEHDVRAALGRPGARDDEAVLLGARSLVHDGLPVDIVIVDHGESDTRPSRPASAGNGRCTLHAPPFEVLRLRLGRRSRDQVLAMHWSADPSPYLDGVFIFGPAASPLIE